jgi:hypothetical protein
VTLAAIRPEQPSVAIDLNHLSALLHATNRSGEAEPRKPAAPSPVGAKGAGEPRRLLD